MEKQEIFDKVVAHLRQQGRKAAIVTKEPFEGTERCRYRSPDGLKCAVGCLISDAEYDPSMEARSVDTLVIKYDWFKERFGNHIRFLTSLQKLHDHHPPQDWEVQFELLAREYGVKYEKPQKA